MEYYDLCLKIIEKELKKFNLDTKAHSEFESGLTALFAENFDVPYNRCAFMSCYATSNILSFKDCIKIFLLVYPKAQDLICEWKSHCEMKVCSLSNGPGLDYLAFVLSILEYDPLPPKLNGAKIVSKYSSWQNTINIMSEVFQEQVSVCGVPLAKLNFDNVKIIQTDDLVKYFSKMGEDGPLRDAHIVLMMKTLNLSTGGLPQEMSILQMLKELLSSLRSDTTIFCLDTKPSTMLFNKALSCFPGKFLCGPIQQTSTIPVIHSEAHGSHPTIRTSSSFFVWRKLPLSFGIHPFSFEIKPVRTDSSMVKENISEILPWRELPKLKIPWGAIFWENASLICKKSLNSLMTLKKESLERHWIGEVARLYLKEYGTATQNCSTLPSKKVIADNNSDECTLEATEILSNSQTLLISQNFNILKNMLDANTEHIFKDNSELQLEKIGVEKVVENVVKSTHVLTEDSEMPTNPETLPVPQSVNIQTEIYTIPQTILTSRNVHSPKDILDTIKENTLLEENCLNTVPTSPYCLNTMNNFNCKSIQGDLIINTSDVFVHGAKEEITLPITFLEKKKTNTKHISRQAEIIRKELKKNVELAAVVNNNIKDKPQFENQLFQIDVQGSLQKKSNITTQTCLKSCSKVIKEKSKYSEILPWRELPPGKIPWGAIFWQNASLTTKKSLKSVLSFEKEILERHWIGEVARLYIKEYGMPILSTSMPKEASEKNISDESAVESTHVLTETSGILSIPQTKLTSQNIHTPQHKLDTKTENVVFGKDNSFDIKPFHIAASNFNCKSVQCDFTVRSLETENIPLTIHLEENLAHPSVMSKITNDFKTQVELPTIQDEVVKKSEPPVTANNNTSQSFKTKRSQTEAPDINQTKNNLASIKALTERVGQLLTSFERLTKENDPITNNETNYPCICHAHQKRNASYNNRNPCGEGGSVGSIHSFTNHASASNNRSSYQNEDIQQKHPSLCNSLHCRSQCCHNMQDIMMPLHSCSMHCHSQACNVPMCRFSSYRQLTCSDNQSYVNSTSQNIVIPVRSISDDALLKIVSILKSG